MRKMGKRLLSLLLAVLMVAMLAPASALAAGTASFVIGPYLLAPKTDSMVAVWETDTGDATTLRWGTAEDALGEPITVERDPDAPSYGGEETNIFRYKFAQLQPGTRYYYEVTLAGGASCKGTFRTLEENPEEIRYISITDTHKFDTKDTFNAAVEAFDPAFIIHGGDMVEGTGTQKEQFAFWFNSGEFIHNYPVVYACGNHDFSDYFDMYVIDTQTEEYGSTVEGDIAFDYGDVHFDLMDSNPWALFQMNAETSGGQMDAETADTIEKSVQWLKDDLAQNQDKKFRILVMHHPISDPYTKMHIASVAEEGHVDMMLAGHTHSYARAVSDDPTVGAGTIYLTHQDSRAVSDKGSYMTHVVKGDVLTTSNMVGDKAVGTTVTAVAKQQLSYSDVSIQAGPVPCNSEIEISATVTNNGEGLAAAVIPVDDNGTMKYIYGDLVSDSGVSTSGEPVRVESNGVKTLDPGESVELHGTIQLTSVGTHTIKVGGATQTVQVNFRPATFSFTNVRTKMGDGAISDISSDVLHIKADVTNIGNESGTATATLYIDGRAIESQQYSIDAGDVKTCEFTYQFEQAGDFQVRIGDSEEQTVSIEGSIQGMPMVKDKSGMGNNGYLHGAPTLGTDDDGNGTIILDGDKDYVEIPDNRNFTIDDGITGMVWAKLPDSPGTGIDTLTPTGRDHNPLMTKGVSIGWGTNYLYRMAVRATGKVTVGIGFDNDNGEFFWNDDDADDNAGIKKGEWVQYVGGFDRTTGGDSYQNTYHSGHIDAPAFDSEIKNWPGASTYIGFSYTGALLTNRGRGIDRTMLAGEISQARLYQSKLTADEVASVYDNPSAAGPKSKDMVLWLDFDPANIVQTGTHTTEWVEAVGAPESLAYDAVIEGDAKIEATVEFSQDRSTVSSSKTYTLQNGAGTIDLTGAGEGAYMRIVTRFTSDLGTDASYMPVLNTYDLKAGGETISWNTWADWKKGTFADGAGHQSADVYRALSADFDDYSGEVDPGTPVDLTFADTSGHWAKEAIDYVSEAGLMNGTSATTFNPDGLMTRGMIVTTLYRLEGEPNLDDENLGYPYADVNAAAYYADAVYWARLNGIVNGYSAEAFGPNDTITREQMAAILYRYAQYKDYDLSAGNDLSAYTDASQISSYAATAMQWANGEGLITGVTDTTLSPQGSATRAVVATILMRFVENVA